MSRRRHHHLYVDWAEHRLVVIDVWKEVIDYAEQRLVMIDLGEDIIGHVDYAEHRLVMTDLEDDVIIHVDWAVNIGWSWQLSKMTSSST